MNNRNVMLLLSSVIGACVIAIAALGFTNWNLSQELKNRHPSPALSQLDSLQNSASIPSVNLAPSINNAPSQIGQWDPFGDISEMHKQMQALMNSMASGDPLFDDLRLGGASTGPSINIEDKPDLYKVVVEIPQGQDVELNTNIKDSQLTISGKVKEEHNNTNSGNRSQVFQSSQFSQSIYLPDPVDEAGMKVDHTKNQFVITLPKV